jgi:hypothetical protein
MDSPVFNPTATSIFYLSAATRYGIVNLTGGRANISYSAGVYPTCSELRISVALLENIAPFLLRFTENKRDSLLTLTENRLTLIENSLKTSAPAHIH